MELNFIVYDKPFGKQRPRVNTRFKSIYTPKETLDYEKEVAEAFKEAYPDHEPCSNALELKIKAFCEVPTSYSNKKKRELYGQPHLNKPDIDNVAKIILDGLNGVAYLDDKQVYKIKAERYYCKEDDDARVEVEIQVKD